MASPSKKKQAEMAERRTKVLAYMQEHGVVTVNDLAKHLEVDSLTANHTVRILIYGGAVKHEGMTSIPNCHGKSTRVCRYSLTGKPFDSELSKIAKAEAHKIKEPEPIPPNCRRVMLLDRPVYKDQGGQGSERTYHIGRGSWGVV